MLKENIKNILKSELYFYTKLQDIFFEIKMAKQRFWKGYDKRAVWGLNSNLLNYIKTLLIDLRDNHYGYPFIEGEIENDDDYVKMINSIIDNIDMAEYYDTLDIGKMDFIKSNKLRKEHQNKALEMLTKYFDCFWD